DLDAILNSAGAVYKKAWDAYIKISGSFDTIVHRDKLAKFLIRKVAWHPHQPLLAIALWNDSVWVYDLSVESWYSCGLSYPSQDRITTLQWKPMSGVVLAVGCEAGVALWHVFRDHTPSGIEAAWAEPTNPLKDHPSVLLSQTYNTPTRATNRGQDTAWVGLSLFKDLGGVDQMAWDPRGELLAVASSNSSTVYIRESVTKELTELRLSFRPTPPQIIRSVRKVAEIASNIKEAIKLATKPDQPEDIAPTHDHGHMGPTVCSMVWSPCGKYLLVAYLSEVARIYEAATWDYVELKDLKGAIQSTCWTPDGHNLIFSLRGDDLIRAVHFEKRAGELTWIPLNQVKMSLRHADIEGYKNAVQNEDKSGDHSGLREHFWKRLGNRNLDALTEFGAIEELTLDPHGERLIVRFENTDLLGVVIVRPTGSMLRDLDIFMPTGFIEGPGWSDGEESSTDEDRGGEAERKEKPDAVTMAFTRHSKGGSILSIAWESGRINFVPFYYLTQNEVDSL
ncbi:hypothetical protein BX616_002274, partial [Lobosporangium transversale]